MSVRDFDWSKAYSESALARSWQQLRNYWRGEEVFNDTLQTTIFDRLLRPNLKFLSREMIERRSGYVPQPFWRTAVPKRGVETRPKEWLYPEDDLVIQTMVNAVGSHLEQGFSPHSYGYRLEKDPKAADQIFENWIERYSNYRSEINRFFALPHDWYYLTTDLSDFYPSIRHDDLLGTLAAEVEDPEVLGLLHKFIRYQWQLPNNKAPRLVEHGVSQGPPYARVLANLYMNKVDSWLGTKSKAFARYVDDMCVVFDSRESAELGLKQLEVELEDLGLSLSTAKTSDIRPLTDPEGIIDLFRKARYEAHQVLHGVESLSGVSGEALTQGLQGYFSSVSNPGDLVKAAQHLNLVLKSQRRLLPPGAKQTAVARTLRDVYLVLRAGPVKAATLRGLIAAVVDYYQGKLPEEFCQLIIDGSDHLKMTAIEVIAGSGAYTDSSLHLLRTLAETSQATLTRSAAFTALYSSATPVNKTWLDQMIQSCDSFTRARAILCYRYVENVDMFAALNAHIGSTDPDIIGAVLYVLIDHGDGDAARPLLSRIPLSSLNRASLITLFTYACLRFSCCTLLTRTGLLEQRPTVAQVLPDLIAELRNDVLLGGRRVSFSALAALLDDVRALPETVRDEALQAVSYACNVVIQTGGPGVPTVLPSSSAGEWGGLEVHKELSRLPGAGRRFFRTSDSGGAHAVIELVSLQDMAASGLSPEIVLEGYLRIPQEHRFPAELMTTVPDPLFAAFKYIVPSSFSPAAVCGPQLVEHAVSAIKRLSVVYESQDEPLVPVLDPFHVFLAPNEPPRLLGVGSSIGIQTYVSRNLKPLVEQSGKPYVLFSGLLLFELISGKCPFAEVKRLEEEAKHPLADGVEDGEASLGTRKVRLIDSPDLARIPHVKWVIQKATLVNSMDRYDTARIMEQDLSMALEALSGRYSDLFRDTPGLAAFDAHGIRLRHLFMSKGLRFRGNYAHARALVVSILSLIKDQDVKKLIASDLLPLKPTLQGPLSRYERFANVLQKSILRLPGPLSSEVWNVVPAVLTYFAMRLQVSRLLKIITAQLDPLRHKPAPSHRNFLEQLYSACTSGTQLVFRQGTATVCTVTDGLRSAEQLLSLDRLVVTNQPEALFHADLRSVSVYLAVTSCDTVEIRDEALSVSLVHAIPASYRLVNPPVAHQVSHLVDQLEKLEGFVSSFLGLQYTHVRFHEFITMITELETMMTSSRTVLASVWDHSIALGGVFKVRTGFLRLTRREVQPETLVNDPPEHLIPRTRSEPIRLDLLPTGVIAAGMLYPALLEFISPNDSSRSFRWRLVAWMKRLHKWWRLSVVAAIVVVTVLSTNDFEAYVSGIGFGVISGVLMLWLVPMHPLEDE